MARHARRGVEQGLDLSAWECAMVGAEPIPASVLREFSQAYAPCGFRPETFFPVYGLAEVTVTATFPTLLAPTVIDCIDREILEAEKRAEPAREGSPAVEFVGLGSSIPGSELRIVDSADIPVAERVVGRILVRSNSLMEAYYKEPEATAAVMRDDWVMTGDLGYQADGCLFVAGREKELIIRGGRGYIPSAIEDIASGEAGVRSGCVVAVGLYSEKRATEKVYVVAETRQPDDEHDALAEGIRETLRSNGIIVNQVVLIPPGALPRTTSGQLKRLKVAQILESAGDFSKD